MVIPSSHTPSSLLDVDVSAYVAQYVSDLLEDGARMRELVDSLNSDTPYWKTEFMAVAMIDISGYSSLSSYFVRILGKLSSEALSEAVGEYISKIASKVLNYQGDIVKFLGDAILVTFSQTENEVNSNLTCERALRCCTSILLECANHDIDLKRWMVAARKGQEHFSGGSDLIWKRLSLHVAVTAGQVTRVVVGVPSLRMDYYVEGDCFADLKDLLDKTKSGQLGISRCIFGMIPNISYPSSEESYCVLNDVQQKKLAADLLLEDIGNLSPFGNTYNIIRSSPLTKVPSQLLEGASLVGLKAMFMNQSLLYQIQGTNARGYKLSNIAPKSFEFRSEYRALSVFFVKLVQYAPPSEIQILLKALLYMLKRFRGVFQQCSVDDKGQTLLACFGLPPFAHERCAVVAAQGAMAFMNSLPTSLKSAVSIAIATGEVLFGTLGTTNRKEAGLLGDVFNIAARLLYIDRQPGCVAIDETTMQLIKDDFLCTSLGLFQIKGKSDVVEVWGIQAGMGQSALTRRGDRIGRDLIGNFGEWDCLKTEVNTWLLGGRERFVAIVEGISGMGKSSLLNCMQDYLLEEKTVFLIMRGNDVEQNSPYASLQVFFQKVLGLFPPPPTMTKRRSIRASSDYFIRPPSMRRESISQVENQLDEHIAYLLEDCGENPSYASLVSEILFSKSSSGALISKLKEKGSIDAEGRKAIVKSVVAKIIGHVIRKSRLVVLLDDAQWIDATSLEVLITMIEATPMICLTIFSRPLDEDHPIALLQHDKKMKLNGLQHDEVKRYFCKRSGFKSVNDQLIDVIMEKTKGNLLQVDTIVTYFVQNAFKLVDEDGRLIDNNWKMMDEMLSRKVESLILAQFDGMDFFLKNILKTASILGQYFRLPDVIFLLDDIEDSATSLCPDILAELIKNSDPHDFICRDDPDLKAESSTFFFRHISIRNAIYESLALTERQGLHLKFALRLENFGDVYPEQKKALLPSMAYHFWRSNDVVKMVSANVDFGCLLVDDYLYFEGREILRQVLDFIQHSEETDDLFANSKNEYQHKPLKQLLAPDRKAAALARLAWASTNSLPASKVIAYAIQSLELCGILWPKNPKESKRAIIKGLLKLIFLWMRSRGGTCDVAVSAQQHEDWHYCVRNCLYALSLVGNLHEEFGVEDKFLVIVLTFNHALLRSRKEPSRLFHTMCIFSFFAARTRFWTRVSKFLTKRLVVITKFCDESAKQAYQLYGALMMAMLDAPANGLEACDLALQYWSERKIDVEIFKCYFLRFYANVLMVGRFGLQHRDVKPLLVKEMMRKDRVWTMCILVTLQMESFYMDMKEKQLEWNAMLEPLAMSFKKEARFPMTYVEGVSECNMAILAVPNVRFDEIVQCLIKVVEELGRLSIPSQVFSTYQLALIVFIGVCATKEMDRGGEDGREMLKRMVKGIAALQNSIRKVRKLCLFLQVAHQIMRGCQAFCESWVLGKPGKKRAVVKWFKTFLNQTRLRNKFLDGGEFMALGAVCCGVIGMLAEKEEERRRYSRRAAKVFGDCGALLLERWAMGVWV